MYEQELLQARARAMYKCQLTHQNVIFKIQSSSPVNADSRGAYMLYIIAIILQLLIGERAKRARRYLVMFMETRDIYIIYICTSGSNTHVRVSVLRFKFKS